MGIMPSERNATNTDYRSAAEAIQPASLTQVKHDMFIG